MFSNILRRRGVVFACIGAALLLGAVQVAGMPARAQQAKPPASQTNREGPVTVKVTPLALSAAEAWRFEVVLDTHSAPLNQDMRAAAALAADGAERAPAAWEGDPPGGHHRKGVLRFEPIIPAPASVTLKIRGVGGVAERSFAWPVANP